MRILCVDDDEDIRNLLVSLLGFSDLEAVAVKDAGAALRLREQEQFSFYILDGQLPGVSGLGLCEQIRRRDRETPIVIFSGHVRESDREAGLRAGADAYIFKPDIGAIAPVVKRLLEGARPAAH